MQILKRTRSFAYLLVHYTILHYRFELRISYEKLLLNYAVHVAANVSDWQRVSATALTSSQKPLGYQRTSTAHTKQLIMLLHALLLLHQLFVLLLLAACLLVVSHQRQHLALGTSTNMQMQPTGDNNTKIKYSYA